MLPADVGRAVMGSAVLGSTIETEYSLTPHPATPAGVVRHITATLSRPKLEVLELHFLLVGDIAQLKLPEPRPPVRVDGLWRRTCFEAFIAHGPGSEYCEFNFSPSGAWAAYRFAAYREGMAPLMRGAPPITAIEVGTERLSLSATLDISWLLKASTVSGLRLGLTAVVEERDTELSYWALKHPGTKPDFHHVESFIVALD